MNQYVVDFQDSILDNLSKTISNQNLYYNHVTKTIVVIALCVLLSIVSNRLLDKIEMVERKKIRVKRIIKNTLLTISLILISIIWINALNSLVIILIILGLFGAVLIRSTLDNVIGWYFIRKRHYFKIGQRIELDGKIGKVVSSNFFYFELAEIKNWLSSESLTGRIIKIPNKEILNTEVFNYSEDNYFVRQEITFLIRHDNNFQAAKDIILSAIEEHYEKDIQPAIEKASLKALDLTFEPSVHLDIQEGGLFLSCQFLVNYNEVAKTKSFLYESILAEFNAHPEIEFAVIEVKKVD